MAENGPSNSSRSWTLTRTLVSWTFGAGGRRLLILGCFRPHVTDLEFTLQREFLRHGQGDGWQFIPSIHIPWFWFKDKTQTHSALSAMAFSFSLDVPFWSLSFIQGTPIQRKGYSFILSGVNRAIHFLCHPRRALPHRSTPLNNPSDPFFHRLQWWHFTLLAAVAPPPCPSLPLYD
jgi:hypothetical protein